MNTIQTTNQPDNRTELWLPLSGPLDRWGAIRLRSWVQAHVSNDCNKIVFDLRKTSFIDSDGIRTLRDVAASRGGVEVSLLNAKPKVHRTLSMSQMDRLVHLPKV